MTSDQTYDFEDDDDLLAAEYALGLLEGDDLETALRRLEFDPTFAEAVTGWEIRLAAMTEELAPVQPRPATKSALMARVAPEPKAAPSAGLSWLWQAVSLFSVAVLVLVLVVNPFGQQDADGPFYTAEIASAEGDFRVLAVVDKTRNEVILTRTAGAAPSGRILQVWAHGPGAPAESVGLWPEGETVRLAMPPNIAAVEGVLTLGVSEEPPGGSPTGSPSGRVFGTVDIPGVTAEL